MGKMRIGAVGPLGFATKPDGRFRAIVPPGRYSLRFDGLAVERAVQVDDKLELGDITYRLKPPIPGN